LNRDVAPPVSLALSERGDALLLLNPMPIKNYTTETPASRSIQEIQDALVKHGASGVLFEYEHGTGRIAALKFKLLVGTEDVGFALPVDWQKFKAVLVEQRVLTGKTKNNDDRAYRTAWRCIRDWVLAQMALYETQMVDLPQVFLPYAITKDGVSTLYDRVLKGNLLGSGGTE
jgi:hypothetical protein